jgi:hypothetical protein
VRNARGNLLHENPVFMRVPRTLSVGNNAAWDGMKSMEKRWFSTIFLGFCACLTENSPFLPAFRYFGAILAG